MFLAEHADSSAGPGSRAKRRRGVSDFGAAVRGLENTRKMAGKLKSGDEAPRSGQYEIIGPRGGRTGEERTSTKGKPLPPTPKPGQSYRLADPTRNGPGKK